MSGIPAPWFTARPREWTLEYGLTQMPARALRRGERPLAGFILPPFQRPLVWTEAQSRLFIESIFAGLPIGSYVYVMKDDEGAFEHDHWLLDGQQRWTAIVDFVDGRLPVFDGIRFEDLDIGRQRRFRNQVFTGMQVREGDEASLREIYERLAYGGTPHLRLGNLARAAAEALAPVMYAKSAGQCDAPWEELFDHEKAAWLQRAEIAVTAANDLVSAQGAGND